MPTVTKEYQKLVRDHVPDLIREKGLIPKTRVLSTDHFERALRHKLVEEAFEVIDASTDAEVISELADLMEVIDASLALRGRTLSYLRKFQKAKREAVGGFSLRIFLESAEGPKQLEQP